MVLRRKTGLKPGRSLRKTPPKKKPAVTYNPEVMQREVAEVRAARSTIAQSARIVGCTATQLNRTAWQETRQAVLERDSLACLRCTAPASDVHHRTPRGSGGTSHPDIAFGMANLVSLCRDCHTWVESNREKSYELGLLVRRTVGAATVPLHLPFGKIYLTHDGGYAPTAP